MYCDVHASLLKSLHILKRPSFDAWSVMRLDIGMSCTLLVVWVRNVNQFTQLFDPA